MEFRFKKAIAQKFLIVLTVFSLVTSAAYMPLTAPRAQAIFGIGDLVIDVKALLRSVADGLAMTLAQRMIDDMVKSTITWANTGFNGNPAYITNPGRYFTNIADQTAGSFIAGSDLGFMCSPFRDTIRLSLALEYYQPPENQFQCTLSGVKGNIENFYEDFSAGGWDSWFSMTQNPTNNPYGAYVTAKDELDSRIAKAVGMASAEQAANQGFLSLKDCAVYNPSQAAIDDYEKGTYTKGSPGQAIADNKVPYDETKPAGACIKDGAIKTAGTTIKAQLDNVLPVGINKLVTVTHIEQLIGAFANGLLQRYVFGSKGTFTPSYNDYYSTSNVPPITTNPGTTPVSPDPSSPQNAPFVSCLTSQKQVTLDSTGVSQPVTWVVPGNVGQVLGANTSYTWTFDLDASQVGSTDTSATVVYTTPGTKQGNVSVTLFDANSSNIAAATCSNTVEVIGSTPTAPLQ